MPEKLSDIEYLRETTPHKLAIMDFIRAKISDLHPNDKAAVLFDIEMAVVDLRGIHKTEAAILANKRRIVGDNQ